MGSTAFDLYGIGNTVDLDGNQAALVGAVAELAVRVAAPAVDVAARQGTAVVVAEGQICDRVRQGDRRWHELVEGGKPVVAYCPMVEMAWLQPDEPIGNPYAPYMLRCGEVVQR